MAKLDMVYAPHRAEGGLAPDDTGPSPADPREEFAQRVRAKRQKQRDDTLGELEALGTDESGNNDSDAYLDTLASAKNPRERRARQLAQWDRDEQGERDRTVANGKAIAAEIARLAEKDPAVPLISRMWRRLDAEDAAEKFPLLTHALSDLDKRHAELRQVANCVGHDYAGDPSELLQTYEDLKRKDIERHGVTIDIGYGRGGNR